MKFKLLVIEDDAVIQKAMKTFLLREGYDVTLCSNGEDALQVFEPSLFHLILLDMMLPKMSGEEVLSTIRKRYPQQPIMVISALSDEFVQLEVFAKEIEDYVVKPFSMNILLFKISTILKRLYGKSEKVIKLENIELHIDQYEVFQNNLLVPLTPREFEILQLMMQNAGKVYSREELLMVIWGYEYLGDSRTVDVHIKNIRKKLQHDPIKTITGVGYKVEK